MDWAQLLIIIAAGTAVKFFFYQIGLVLKARKAEAVKAQ